MLMMMMSLLLQLCEDLFNRIKDSQSSTDSGTLYSVEVRHVHAVRTT